MNGERAVWVYWEMIVAIKFRAYDKNIVDGTFRSSWLIDFSHPVCFLDTPLIVGNFGEI